MWNTNNMYLNGPFAPWRQEGEAFDLEVVGTIPRELNGALYRVGSSQHYKPARPERYHWFDGDGMVHGIFIRDGRAHYRNRLVRTAGLQMEMKEGSALFGSVINGSGDPIDMDSGRPPFKNPGNTNVTLFNNRVLAFAEVDVPHELHPDTLETVGLYHFDGSVSGAITAHFKIDPDTGDMLMFGVNGEQLTWYRSGPDVTILDRHTFDMGAPCFVHDFGVTKNFAIFCISPQLFALDTLVQGHPSIIWDVDTVPVSRFAVLSRATGKVSWFDADGAFQLSHVYNAYEVGQDIVLEGHRSGVFGHRKSDTESVPENGDYNAWFTSVRTYPTRWTMNIATGQMVERQLNDVSGEFPRINDTLSGTKHNFNYMTTIGGPRDWLSDALVKHDLRRDQIEMNVVDGLTSPSEAVFVARDGATAEDDGWLLSIWWDQNTDRSEIVVQHAQDFSGAPVARIKLNHRVPLGFHGNWVSAAQLDAAVLAA